MDLTIIVVPVFSNIRTDEAHVEALTSRLFTARLKRIVDMVEAMKEAISCKDIPIIGRLAEEDSINLHAITMTGKLHVVLWEPETVRVIKEVIKMRAEGVPAWYSMDTGPSVFINTVKDQTEEVVQRLTELRLPKVIVSGVGDGPSVSNSHLF